MKILKLLKISLICILTSVPVLAQTSNELSASVNKLSFKLYKNIIKDESSNLIFSPISLSTAFAQVYIGSNNKTKHEISHLFGFNESIQSFEGDFADYSKDVFSHPSDSSIELLNANSVWLDKKINLKDSYPERLKTNFNSEVFRLDFKDIDNVVKKANAWASQNTKNKIQEILNRNIFTDETKLFILNALYFKDKWQYKFDKNETMDDDFFITASEKLKTKMMNNTALYSYGNFDKYETILLPYKTKNYSMLVLLPKDVDGLNKLEKSIEIINIKDLLSKMRARDINLSMPSFKFQYQIKDLKQTLKNLGIIEAFDQDGADFRDLLINPDKENLFIEDVLQKAFIEVNEEGTEAAAVTAISGGIHIVSVPLPPLRIKIDHPFIFFIIEGNTRSILFMGRCINPKL